jgi:hypothetical protein
VLIICIEWKYSYQLKREEDIKSNWISLLILESKIRIDLNIEILILVLNFVSIFRVINRIGYK